MPRLLTPASALLAVRSVTPCRPVDSSTGRHGDRPQPRGTAGGTGGRRRVSSRSTGWVSCASAAQRAQTGPGWVWAAQVSHGTRDLLARESGGTREADPVTHPRRRRRGWDGCDVSSAIRHLRGPGRPPRTAAHHRRRHGTGRGGAGTGLAGTAVRSAHGDLPRSVAAEGDSTGGAARDPAHPCDGTSPDRPTAFPRSPRGRAGGPRPAASSTPPSGHLLGSPNTWESTADQSAPDVDSSSSSRILGRQQVDSGRSVRRRGGRPGGRGTGPGPSRA